jgi:iron-sulfur cluster repair protein YtfE (RIC family)
MATFSDVYAHDHDRLDELFGEYAAKKAADGDRAVACFREFKDGLERHIVWEEELLFPLWEAKTGMRDAGPTVVMRREHQQIREFLTRMEAMLGTGAMPTAADDTGLAGVLATHNAKEEMVLYPMIDRHASDEEREQVFASMQPRA